MNTIKALIISLLIFPLTSCAMEPMQSEADVFYQIDKQGNVIAVNAKGKKVQLERVEIPFKHNISEIKSIEHLTIIELQGSHFRLICTSSHRCYYQPLPH
ncbi:MAG: hypothetical protein ABW176_19040 [Candidatus Thiodiazotropha endolucinida]